MPYYYDSTLEDDQKNQDPTNIQISGASPSADSEGSVQQTGPSKNPSLNTGSGFQNLDSYLKVNQPQQFAGQVVGKVQGELDTAKQNQDSGASQFRTQVQNADQLPTNDQVNTAVANPTGTDASQYQNWEHQAYTGPKSLGESQDAYNKYWSGTNKAGTSANLLGNESGRFTLLDQYYGRPNYSYGQKSLDNLLVQGGNIGDQTKDLQGQAAQLNAQGKTTATALGNEAAQRSAAVADSAKYARSAVGLGDDNSVVTDANAQGYGALGKQYQAVTDTTASKNAEREAELQNFKSNLSSLNLTDAQMAAIGLSNTGQHIFDLDLSKYATPGAALNQNQAMTPEQRSYIRALSQLAGITDTFANGIPQSEESAYGFDKNTFLADVDQKNTKYQRAVLDEPVTVFGNTKRLEDVENDIKMNQADLGKNPDRPISGTSHEGRVKDYLSKAISAVAEAKKRVSDRYQAGRTINAPNVGLGPMYRGG